MHTSNSISSKLLAHFFKMVADGAITELDIKAFVQNPTKWREDYSWIPIARAQEFWQKVWDDLLGAGKVSVPPVPTLTEKQGKSLNKFGFVLVYIPDINEEEYPACFVKPNWVTNLGLSGREVSPVWGKWRAVETIRKPDWDDPAGYPDDRLMNALKRGARFFTSWIDLHTEGGILEQVAGITGFPKKFAHLPTAKEWSVVANLFNWLRDHRSMPLPDLGSTRSSEMVKDILMESIRVGNADRGGLEDVQDHEAWRGCCQDNVGFRILIVL